RRSDTRGGRDRPAWQRGLAEKRHSQPFTSINDIARLETRPYREGVPATTTFDILRRSAALCATSPPLTFLESGDPNGPFRTARYEELLVRTTQAANLFRRLGVESGDA